MTLSILAMAGTQLFISQYLQLVEGLTPFVAGLWMIPGAAGLILGTNLGPALARRVRPATIVGTGLLLTAAGYGLLTQLPTSSGLAILMIATFAIGVGLGPMMTLSTDLIVNSAPPEKAGSASATSETGGELGMALGIAVIGSVGNAVYRSEVSGAVPAGTPAEAAVDARNTLSGVVDLSDRLSGQIGADLLATARDAFTHALHVNAAISGSIMAAVAVLTMVVQRHVRPHVTVDAEPPAAADRADSAV